MASREMLDWQYRQLLGELQQVQLHASDPTCPCSLSNMGEYCLPKHVLNVATLAAETAAMDPPNAQLLFELQESSVEMHEILREHVCGEGDDVDAVEWSRTWRKKIEALYYACALQQGEAWDTRRVDPQTFKSAQEGMERFEFLTDYTEEELDDFALYLSPSGKAGYGLTPDRELINVFNNGGPKGEGARMVIDAIARGATHLDCFSPALPRYYHLFDFVEYNRNRWDPAFTPEGWDHERYGEPDVVYMRYAGVSRDVADVTRRYEAAAGRRAPWRQLPEGPALSFSGGPGEGERRGLCQEDASPHSRPVQVCSAAGRIASPTLPVQVCDNHREGNHPTPLIPVTLSQEISPTPDPAILMSSKEAVMSADPLLVEIARQVCGAGLCADRTPSCKPVGKYYHCQTQPKSRFDPRSFRTVSPAEGVKITVGCPKGEWDGNRKACRVGTEDQKVMYRKDVCSDYKGCRPARRAKMDAPEREVCCA